MRFPLHVICHFSLVAFNILSLSLIFANLITTCLSSVCSSLGLSCLGLNVLLDLVDYFLSHVREFFSYYLFKYFLRCFFSLFYFWDPYKVNVGVFDVVPEVSEFVFVSFNSFFYIIFCAVISTSLSSGLFICASALVILLWIPSSVLFISVLQFL